MHCQQVRSDHNLRHVFVRYLAEGKIHFVADFGGSVAIQTEVFHMADYTNDLRRAYHEHVDFSPHRVLAGKQVLGHHVINHHDGSRSSVVVSGEELPSSRGMRITRR